jgi:hypothetical protein
VDSKRNTLHHSAEFHSPTLIGTATRSATYFSTLQHTNSNRAQYLSHEASRHHGMARSKDATAEVEDSAPAHKVCTIFFICSLACSMC